MEEIFNIPISRIPLNVRYKSCSGDFRQSNVLYTVSIDLIDAIRSIYLCILYTVNYCMMYQTELVC